MRYLLNCSTPPALARLLAVAPVVAAVCYVVVRLARIASDLGR